MTVTSSLSKIIHLVNPAVIQYPFPFKILEKNQLKALLLDSTGLTQHTLLLETDYTVSGLGENSGGHLHLTSGGQAKIQSGQKLLIKRSMPFTQEVDYRPHDLFPAETHERTLDILTMQDQELREMISRAILGPEGGGAPVDYAIFADLAETCLTAAQTAQSEAGAATAAADRALAVELSLSQNIPLGHISIWPLTVSPSGWLICDGSSLSASLYPQLFAILGYAYGGSAGMFKIPDLRNQFIRGASASRSPGSIQGDAGRNLTGTCLPGSLPGTFGPIAVNGFSGVFTQVSAGAGLSITGANSGINNYGIALNAAIQWPIDTEFRPANVAMNYIIRVDD